MTWSVDKVGDLSGKVAIVTGSNTGLGYENAKLFAGKGMSVVMACRTQSKAEDAMAEIRLSDPKADVQFIALDLSDLDSVRSFAKTFTEKFSRLDLLVNNAGVMNCPFALSKEGLEMQLATNYMGHFLLSALLMPLLESTEGARIVQLSSLAHLGGKISETVFNQVESRYSKTGSYCISKFACLVFSFELDRRLKARGSSVLSVAAHPGVSGTELVRHDNMPELLVKTFSQSAYSGSLPTAYAALGDDIIGGDYTGPRLLNVVGAPKKVFSKSSARNKAVGELLWSRSEEIVGQSFFAA